MEFWLIKEGEKEGPILDFELRSRIRSGEVTEDQKVWYQGLDAWTPAGELDILANEFVETEVTSENVDDYLATLEAELEEREPATPGKPTPPPVPAEIHLWRRFGARWFDYLAYLSLFYLVVAFSGTNLQAMWQRAFFPLVLILPWVFFEAASLHLWGTTPGKWLVGLRVRGPDSRHLTAGSALLRTMRVMILGMGFGLIFLREICHLVALWFAVKKKVVLWDGPVGIRVERAPESPQKWVAFGVGLFFFFSVLMTTIYQIRLAQMSPAEREEYEQMQEKVERVLDPNRG